MHVVEVGGETPVTVPEVLGRNLPAAEAFFIHGGGITRTLSSLCDPVEAGSQYQKDAGGNGGRTGTVILLLATICYLLCFS
jgi:hypothetical protein